MSPSLFHQLRFFLFFLGFMIFAAFHAYYVFPIEENVGDKVRQRDSRPKPLCPSSTLNSDPLSRDPRFTVYAFRVA